MSLFKSKAIVLKKSDFKNKTEQLITIFSYEYGKINVLKKRNRKEKEIDLGNIINFEIKTTKENSISKISNIKIISEFTKHDNKFETMNSYLELLFLISKQSPLNNPIYEVFEIVNILNKTDNIKKYKIILLKLKLLYILGEKDIYSEDLTITKILKFIYNNSIENILKLSGINKDLEKKLEESILCTKT